jgi:hypothetical protein
MKSIFYTPSEERIEDPNSNYVSSLILDQPSSYWESGSTDAMIKYLDNDGYTISEMILMLRDPFGVYVQFNEPKTSQFVMCRDLHNPQLEEEVTIKLGGNPWTLPRSYFIDRQIAAQVASSYIDSKSGERPSGFGWIES